MKALLHIFKLHEPYFELPKLKCLCLKLENVACFSEVIYFELTGFLCSVHKKQGEIVKMAGCEGLTYISI
jgi:hypothetical protein